MIYLFWSILGQEELNPSSIGSFLSKHWWALATKKKIRKSTIIYLCLLLYYYLTTFYNSLTLPAIHCHLIHKLHIATYYLDYVSVKLLNLSECYNVMSLLCCNFVLLILSLNEYLTTLITVEKSTDHTPHYWPSVFKYNLPNHLTNNKLFIFFLEFRRTLIEGTRPFAIGWVQWVDSCE